jgi:undecaprenyl-diphosphatase
LACLALVALDWLADEMRAGDTLAFDLRLRDAVHALATPKLTHLCIVVSTLGGPSVLVPVGALFVAAFAWRRWWRGAVLLLLAMLGANLLDFTLKHTFQRARPSPFFHYPLPASFSFPSGHALFAFCFFTTAAALTSPRLRHPVARGLVWAVAATLILAIGFSRIYLGVHYPSDVAAGYAAGLLWCSVIIAGDRVAHARARRRGEA